MPLSVRDFNFRGKDYFPRPILGNETRQEIQNYPIYTESVKEAETHGQKALPGPFVLGMPEHPKSSPCRGLILAQCQFSRATDVPQNNGVFVILMSLLWFCCVFDMNASVLVKAKSKQDETEPDTVLVRPLDTHFVPLFGPEYTTLFFVI